MSEIGAVERAINGERPAEFPGAAAEVGDFQRCAALRRRSRSKRAHGFDFFDGFERAHEHGHGFVELAADDVEAVVHAVSEVDVGGAGLRVHRFVAFGPSAVVGVAGAVVYADVGLGLDYAAREAGAVGEDPDEEPAQEGWREAFGVA